MQRFKVKNKYQAVEIPYIISREVDIEVKKIVN